MDILVWNPSLRLEFSIINYTLYIYRFILIILQTVSSIYKSEVHNKNIHILQDIFELLDSHEQVEVITINTYQFLDYYMLFVSLYKIPHTDTINRAYVFVVDQLKGENMVLIVRVHMYFIEVTQNLMRLKKGRYNKLNNYKYRQYGWYWDLFIWSNWYVKIFGPLLQIAIIYYWIDIR